MLDRAADTAAGDPAVRTYHLSNPRTGAHFYVLRNDTTAERSTTLPVVTAAGTLTVPADGSGIRLIAKDAKLLVTEIALGSRRLRYSTAQPMLQQTIGGRDIGVFTGRTGDPVELAIVAPEQPAVTLLDGAATTAYDAAAGLLRLNATLAGLTRLLITTTGTTPLLLLLADDDASAALWPYDTPSGPLLVRGPALLRTARVDGATARLTGDTTAPSDLEVWAPHGVRNVTWNGRPVSTVATASDSLAARAQLPGPPAIHLPALTGWRRAPENPEAAPGFDDSAWTAADLTTSHSSTPVPAGQPVVLFADDYGFHYGDVWYRARFTGALPAGQVALSYQTGTQGLLMAWLDGTPLGTHRQPVPTLAQAGIGTWAATASFATPALGAGEHVLSVLVRPMAHDEDGGARDSHKAARGLTAAAFPGVSPAPALSWRLQGAAAPDPVRGPLNTGGLYGERQGWHLPGYHEDGWQPVTLPYTETRQGVAWYRTAFRLDVPGGVDASLGLTFADDRARAYRVQIFVNGWNLGQYVNDVGPQHTFVLPTGPLDPRGENVLALAVLTDGTTPAGPPLPTLTVLHSALGGH
jgi:beta-galactosidase GanA